MNYNILIYGGGRWAKIVIKEVSTLSIIKKILVFTKNKKNILNWIKKKKIKKTSLILNRIDKKIKYAIICNSNKNHYKSAKFLLNKKINLLIEKPLNVSIKKIEHLKKIAKRKKLKIFIGMQFFYSELLKKIKKKIANKEIKNIVIYWNDRSNEKVDNIIKKHDKSISFKKDIFYHFYAIIFQLTGKIIKINNRNILKNTHKFLCFKFNKIIFQFIFSRNSSIRQRVIKIQTSKEIYLIDFSDYNKCKVQYKNSTQIFKDKTLKKQCKYFLVSKFKNKLQNNIMNLNNFFKIYKSL